MTPLLFLKASTRTYTVSLVSDSPSPRQYRTSPPSTYTLFTWERSNRMERLDGEEQCEERNRDSDQVDSAGKSPVGPPGRILGQQQVLYYSTGMGTTHQIDN
jgi:hypothetical protein